MAPGRAIRRSRRRLLDQVGGAARAGTRSAPGGLSSGEAQARLRAAGPNAIGRKGGHPAVAVFARQFRSPLVLILVAGAAERVFQTAWFVESLITELAIVLIVRTRKPFWKSRPSGLLSWLTLAVEGLALALPRLPGADRFGFVPLPVPVMAGLVAVTLACLAASEATKRWFFARERRHAGRRR